MERCVKPAGLRSIAAVRSRVGVLKEYLGQRPLEALEDPDEINQFKTDSEYAEGVEIATMYRVLEMLRGDELGHGANAAVVQPLAVPPVRRPCEQEGRDLS